MTMRPGGAVFGMLVLVARVIERCDVHFTCSIAAGSLVGAGGVTAYNAYHSSDWGIVRTLQWWVEKGQADTARANNPELARLEDMV